MMERVDAMNCSKCTNVYYNTKSRMTKHTTTLCRSCLEECHTLYIEHVMKEQQMTEQNKILIDPSEYKDLKEGDEIEYTIRGKIKFNPQTNGVVTIEDDDLRAAWVAFKNKQLVSIHKILPKATPLEVGEIIRSKTGASYEVLKVYPICFFNQKTQVAFTSTNPAERVLMYRESGIPIDWEATFK